MPATPYRGRFAPSPSGPLHFGSLITALGSYLDAKSQGGEWQVRIDDLDPPRVALGAVEDILRALAAYGLEWDGNVQYQSCQGEAYAAALNDLQRLGVVYDCACTRREIADSSVGHSGVAIYPGTCRNGIMPGRTPRAQRVDTRGAQVQFDDRLQGHIEHDLERLTGDFILKRADGLFAYQLAAVVDDRQAGITDIVRGADLIDSTLRQIYLMRLLGWPQPHYLHLPVAVNAVGEKLSKQTLAPPLDCTHPQPTLVRALRFLQHAPPKDLESAPVRDILAWAVRYWQPSQVPPVRTLPQ